MSSKSKVIQAIESEQMGKEIPTFAPGDTIVVQVKVKKALASVCRRLKVWSLVSVTVA
ncbi:hypothetical protein HORIV_06320 [Vreelandella olivaria]|uniref:50S ribosomal protein L19 n=1 Tax=Vreelandella olivaria TaxID=390919 RepID=A0ABM7GCG2_9GAMM|nr:hypothetical protein HORIV_06320 [Halomonas olivaria]